MSKQIRIAVDYENNAETWWDAAHDTKVTPDNLAQIHIAQRFESAEAVTVSAEEADAFRKWAATLPGWESGMVHAPHPFTFNDAD